MSVNWNATNPLQAFQKFWSLAKSWLEDQAGIQRYQYHKIGYLLGPKGIEALKSFTWNDPTDKENPAKGFDKFENSFQKLNIQWSYREEAHNLTTVRRCDSRTTRH